MEKANPKLEVTKPKSAFTKPLTFDAKNLFTALSKGVGHVLVQKWEELGADAVEALSAIGLTTEPGELAFLLIRRSITRALFDLVGESASLFMVEARSDEDALIEQLDFSMSVRAFDIDSTFLDRPSDLPIIHSLDAVLQQWLEKHKLSKATAKAIVERLPSYFVYALNSEWRRNAKSYAPVLDAINTPFTKAGEREWAWAAYSALLQRRVQESIFEEPFSLSQIYVPLNAYYPESSGRKDSITDLGLAKRPDRRIVVELQNELEEWLQKADPQDTIRVISGGPGSGKSSFLRIFSSRTAKTGILKVLFIPLHLIDPSKELVDEVGRFVRDEGALSHNPLAAESPEPNLLIIFDGLDELANQGKAAAETARAFVREIERTSEKRNLQGLKLRVLISGRELVVQENESEFRRARQVLSILPYFMPGPREDEEDPAQPAAEYVDPQRLLAQDLRQQWWRNYGALTGRGYERLPEGLGRRDLDEITAQPLLNYLVALSFTRKKLDFTKDVNLNSIYADLVAAVYERGYEKGRAYGPIRHMTLDSFLRVLEEIGLAAWHGDGRTTTVSEIEEHCRASGLGELLDSFQDGARAGVTRLLAAFFFRQYGQRPTGDATFEFTHKSFGEYLAARRIVRAVARVIKELRDRTGDPDSGWDEKEALKRWGQACGPSPISRDLHVFLQNEVELLTAARLGEWQDRLSTLFGFMVRHGMPMEQLQIRTFKDTLFQARNAEEALLVALSACARVTKRVSVLDLPDPAAFGAWFKRIQGQRTSPRSSLAARCLSFLDLTGSHLELGDFFMSDLRFATLKRIEASVACFRRSNLAGANLQNSVLEYADLSSSNCMGADLRESRLLEANFGGAFLDGADFRKANLRGANLRAAAIAAADFRDADLRGADLRGARLVNTKLEGANLEAARLDDAASESVGLNEASREDAAAESLELFPTDSESGKA